MPKKVRRRWCASLTILAAAISGVAINCGRSGGGQGPGGNVSELIPAGWDGKSDWESKRWIVADLNSGTARKRPASTIPGQRRIRSLCGEPTSQPHGSQGRFLVRVKLFQGGAPYASLAGNPRIRQKTLRPSPEISELTLEAFSLQEVEELARKFHGHSAGCAGVELLSAPGINLCGTPMANGVITITPPVFDETIKLSMVENMLPGVTPTNIRADMTTLQGLGSRYYNGSQALSASNSVQTIMTSTYAATGWSGLATTNQVSHSGFTQRSVVSSLPGLEENDTTVIIGSHLDSIHPANQADAPGADDNASGVAVMAEVMRVLSRSNTRFKRRVEWHAYGIEEIGLVGSGQIASNYAATGRKVAAMLQLDMAAYAPEAGSETIHLFHDDTTTGLRRSVKDLLTTYLGGNFTDLGLKVAGTSDHRSWYRAGYPSFRPDGKARDCLPFPSCWHCRRRF
ncbi:M20/M25/M40 family metallo-hydrolase [bacterium]|nr:M20/M25/M40 family metallo-hydrolase [bacterium]